MRRHTTAAAPRDQRIPRHTASVDIAERGVKVLCLREVFIVISNGLISGQNAQGPVTDITLCDGLSQHTK